MLLGSGTHEQRLSNHIVITLRPAYEVFARVDPSHGWLR